MKISIIVAAYNIDKYIFRCISSVISQTLRDIEIIVVNDGSTDSTLSIINDMSLKDKRIRIIDKKHEGSIEARKSGLKVAKGEYILFVDGDDWLEPYALEKLYNNAISNKSDIVIYNAYLSHDNRRDKFKCFNKDCVNDYLKNLFLGDIIPCMWCKLIKLEYIKINNIEFPSNISYAEDSATSVALFMNKPKVSFLDEHLYNYYQREGSITKSINNKVLEIDKALEFIKIKLIEKNIYEEYKNEFEYMVYDHLIKEHFINTYFKYELGKVLLNQYKSRNIDVSRNTYIKERISKYPISAKIRIYAYLKHYKLGKLYDKFRNTIKR